MAAIVIEDYNPEWPVQFLELKAVFVRALGNRIGPVEHVGSTSVPGLAAKPVLDIDVIVSDEARLREVIPLVEALGYEFRGDQGIPGRYAFHRVSGRSPDEGTGSVWPAHHLYCCIRGAVSLANHLSFRDALRGNAQLAAAYGALKRAAAATAPDMDAYVESKSAFIAAVLEQAGLPAADVGDIVRQNRRKS